MRLRISGLISGAARDVPTGSARRQDARRWRRAGSVGRDGNGGIRWNPGRFRRFPDRRHEQTAGRECGGDSHRVRGIALKPTIRTAESGLSPILVECGRHVGDEDAHREDSNYGSRTRRATRASRTISPSIEARQIGAPTIAISPLERNGRGCSFWQPPR